MGKGKLKEEEEFEDEQEQEELENSQMYGPYMYPQMMPMPQMYGGPAGMLPPKLAKQLKELLKTDRAERKKKKEFLKKKKVKKRLFSFLEVAGLVCLFSIPIAFGQKLLLTFLALQLENLLTNVPH